jgi:hypothetical protein
MRKESEPHHDQGATCHQSTRQTTNDNKHWHNHHKPQHPDTRTRRRTTTAHKAQRRRAKAERKRIKPRLGWGASSPCRVGCSATTLWAATTAPRADHEQLNNSPETAPGEDKAAGQGRSRTGRDSGAWGQDEAAGPRVEKRNKQGTFGCS